MQEFLISRQWKFVKPLMILDPSDQIDEVTVVGPDVIGIDDCEPAGEIYRIARGRDVEAFATGLDISRKPLRNAIVIRARDRGSASSHYHLGKGRFINLIVRPRQYPRFHF